MFCDSAYRDTYDLYRPVLSMNQARDHIVTIPDTATESGRICRFIESAGSGISPDQMGTIADYDALMFIPTSQDLRPEKRGRDADVVKISGRWWTVLKVWETAGNHMQKVALQERRV